MGFETDFEGQTNMIDKKFTFALELGKLLGAKNTKDAARVLLECYNSLEDVYILVNEMCKPTKLEDVIELAKQAQNRDLILNICESCGEEKVYYCPTCDNDE